MKGIVMGMGILALCMGVSLGLIFYVSHESLRLDTDVAFKQAMQETMVQLDRLDPMLREERALSLFIENFAPRKQSGILYTADLMGFMADPLALRIRLTAFESGSPFTIRIVTDETMIEVNHENE